MPLSHLLSATEIEQRLVSSAAVASAIRFGSLPTPSLADCDAANALATFLAVNGAATAALDVLRTHATTSPCSVQTGLPDDEPDNANAAAFLHARRATGDWGLEPLPAAVDAPARGVLVLHGDILDVTAYPAPDTHVIELNTYLLTPDGQGMYDLEDYDHTAERVTEALARTDLTAMQRAQVEKYRDQLADAHKVKADDEDAFARVLEPVPVDAG